MLKFIELITSASSTFSNMDFSTFDDLPFHFYSKDYNGKYIASNRRNAQDAGCQNASEILNLTDKDLSWSNTSQQLRANDQKVILANTAQIFYEKEAFLVTKIQKTNGISFKRPLLSQKNKSVIGIVGVTIMLQKYENSDYLNLSSRQQDCLWYLVKGNSIKQIAKILYLSPRTVENYLNNAKEKLNCQTRQDLIARAFLMPEIRDKLLFDC